MERLGFLLCCALFVGCAASPSAFNPQFWADREARLQSWTR